jgi:hypothetical protein
MSTTKDIKMLDVKIGSMLNLVNFYSGNAHIQVYIASTRS